MQQRQTTGLRGEILAQFGEIVEVADAHQRGQPALGEDVVVVADIERRNDQEGDRGHQQKGRHQAADTARVKIAEAEAAFVHLTGQQAGDHETRDHEEHVDADKAAADARKLKVVNDYQ